MRARGVIFDLDGTLLDTLEDIASAMNHALAESGMATHPLSAYRGLIGWGGAELVRRACPMGDHDALLARFRARYDELSRPAAGTTRPYEGVPQLLQSLVARAVPLAVLSNKPHGPTISSVAHYFPDIPFVAVLGASAHVPLKPEPAAALSIAEGFALDPEECVFVGDTEIDVETARRAGMCAAGVTWGFRAESVRSRADVVLEHPADLLAFVGR